MGYRNTKLQKEDKFSEMAEFSGPSRLVNSGVVEYDALGRRIRRTTTKIIQAPLWSRGGESLVGYIWEPNSADKVGMYGRNLIAERKSKLTPQK